MVLTLSQLVSPFSCLFLRLSTAFGEGLTILVARLVQVVSKFHFLCLLSLTIAKLQGQNAELKYQSLSRFESSYSTAFLAQILRPPVQSNCGSFKTR